MNVRISSALPVKVYLNGEEKYNNIRIPGRHTDEYFVPWSSEDPFRMQVLIEDDLGAALFMTILDAQGGIIDTVQFTRTQISPPGPSTTQASVYDAVFTPSDLDIANQCITVCLMISQENGVIEINADDEGYTDLISDDGPLGPFTETWTFNPGIFGVAFNGTGSASTRATIDLEDLLGSGVSEGGILFNANFGFVASGGSFDFIIEYWNDMGMIDSEFIHAPVADGPDDVLKNILYEIPEGETVTMIKIRIQTFESDDRAVAFVSISLNIFEELGCIDRMSVSNNDYQDLDETVLIAYSSSNNFAGLYYNHISPAPTFYMRIPGEIPLTPDSFKPQEIDEDADQSNGTVISVSSEVKFQRKLRTGHLPEWAHRALVQALKHTSLTINGEQFTKKETYTILEGSKKITTRPAEIWLTETNTVVRNVR